jgi:SAM-dependent methyltransferase
MPHPHNPQASQMSDESMVRNLAAQAEAIWPQELPLIERYGLPDQARILDVGCGTGEIAQRLLERFPRATLLGLDQDERHLEVARRRCARFPGRAEFRVGDALALDVPGGSFDLAVCRHLLQAVPHPERVCAGLARAARPGGRVHLVAEDYGMIHFHPTRYDADEFFREGPSRFAASTGTDLSSGRKMFSVLKGLGLGDVRVDWIVVDTVRVPRATFAAIWRAWRDGYTDVIAEHSRFSRDEVRARWDDMIACIEREDGYAVWFLPVVSGAA